MSDKMIPSWPTWFLIPKPLSPSMHEARERARIKYEHEQQVLRSMGRKIIARCLGLPQ